jgi:large-conductance mechanosensitive channel
MAAQGSRTLKLSLLADVAEFSKGIKVASKDTETIGDQFTAFGKKAAVAFAAAGAAIGAFAIASVKAAAEDETGQRKLEETIRNTTSATADQIAGIDKYITAQSIATATTDDVIRPALSRLLRATGDLTKAQALLTLSQEISVATGKPLEAVTNALGKAFEGSNTALSKLGIGIDKTTLSTLTFDQTQQLLNKTFDGFIENQSETAAFKFQQISIAVNESKEAIGAALLPVVKEFADFLIVTVVPAIESFVAGLTGKEGLAEGLTESQQKAVQWGKKVRSVIDTVIDLKDELIAVAVVIGTVFVVSKISAAVLATIALINTLIKAYNLLKASSIVAGVASAFALNPLLGVGAVALAAGVLSGANALAGRSDSGSAEAPSTGSIPFAAGFGPSKVVVPVVPSMTGGATGGTGGGGISTATSAAASAASNIVSGSFGAGTFRAAEAATSGATYNINVSGAFDRERTAREIVDTINDSFYRGTGGANNLQLA